MLEFGKAKRLQQRRDVHPRGIDELTPRDLEVFRLLATGMTNSEIATQLIVGETTVKTHVTRILMKLGLRDRVQAVVLAYEAGIVTPGDTSLPSRNVILLGDLNVVSKRGSIDD